MPQKQGSICGKKSLDKSENIYYVMGMTKDVYKHKISLFKKMAKHMLKQLVQSKNRRGTCAYRNLEGLKCPVGVLIKDKYYDKYFEGVGLSPNTNLSKEKTVLVDSLRKSGVLIDDETVRSMLRDFQNIHDNYWPVEWQNELYCLADDHLSGMSQRLREKLVESCTH